MRRLGLECLVMRRLDVGRPGMEHLGLKHPSLERLGMRRPIGGACLPRVRSRRAVPQASPALPAICSNASRYLLAVCSMIAGGRAGAGGVLSQSSVSR